MSDLKGTINYLRAVRDICKKASSCDDCRLGKQCPYYEPPFNWNDSVILSLIKYAEQAQKEGE